MGNNGKEYQVNLHSQKIAKISFKTCMPFPRTEMYMYVCTRNLNHSYIPGGASYTRTQEIATSN
jgi:hypothetical protein